FEIGEENAAPKVHNGKTAIGTAQHERQGAVRQDGDVCRLSDYRNVAAQRESHCVMNAERPVAAVHHKDGLAVWGGVGEDGVPSCLCARYDGARPSVNREELG